jgi:hypothetical protein
MNPITQAASTISHEDIAQLASLIWKQEGRLGGRDREYWLEAERQLQTMKWEGNFSHNKALVKLDVSASAFEKKTTPPSGSAVARPVVSRKGRTGKAKGN